MVGGRRGRGGPLTETLTHTKARVADPGRRCRWLPADAGRDQTSLYSPSTVSSSAGPSEPAAPADAPADS